MKKFQWFSQFIKVTIPLKLWQTKLVCHTGLQIIQINSLHTQAGSHIAIHCYSSSLTENNPCVLVCLTISHSESASNHPLNISNGILSHYAASQIIDHVSDKLVQGHLQNKLYSFLMVSSQKSWRNSSLHQELQHSFFETTTLQKKKTATILQSLL